MALLRQIVNGVRIHALNVQATADDLDALKGLMVGKIEEWESKATGGSSAALPDKLNKYRFRIGKVSGARESCAITIHHLDPAKNENDVRNAVIGKFNASWYVEDKAEYCEPIYRKN